LCDSGFSLLIEPNLRSPSGHYAEFVRAIGNRNAGKVFEVFAHPDADAMLDSMHGIMVCRKRPRVGEPFAEWRIIYRCITDNSPFLLLTADGRHAAAASLSSLLSGNNPAAANFFFHRAPTTWRDNLLYPFTEIAREHSRAITSTEQVAGLLRSLGWKRVEYIPYPALAPLHQPEPLPFSHLLMAGAARLNKGLDLVADLACKWAAESRSIPLFVQVSKKHLTKHGKKEAVYVEKLLSAGYQGLKCDADAPERSGYIERFKGALVLAPYVRDQFASQVSGVVLDALLHGAPVIATKGTWPALQVQRFGAGVAIEVRTVESLEAAIEVILSDWDTFSARACEAARILAKEHDPIHLVRLLGLNREQ
jgi:hypothetical protein